MSQPSGSSLEALKDLRILVAEDEAFIAMYIEDVIQDLGCHPIGPFSTVEAAEDALRQERPDGALLDMNLNGCSIAPVAELLAEQGIPFLLITGYGSLDAMSPVLAGAPILRKPFSAADLSARLLDLLKHRARSR